MNAKKIELNNVPDLEDLSKAEVITLYRLTRLEAEELRETVEQLTNLLRLRDAQKYGASSEHLEQEAAGQISSQLPNAAPVNPLELLAWPGVLAGGEAQQTDLVKQADQLFNEALEQLKQSRAREGAELGTLIAFFRARRGAARGFRLADPYDFSSSGMTGAPTMLDQLLGTGDGLTASFRLVKNYGGPADPQIRAITRPREDSIRISVAGAGCLMAVSGLLAIAGEGPFETELRALVDRLGLVESVHFCGGISYDNLPDVYSSADVVAMPSRNEPPAVEGFGIVFLEANACERPVIGAATGGIPDAIIDGETGVLVPPVSDRSSPWASSSPPCTSKEKVPPGARHCRW